ncbi:MAG: hypothetical protein ABIG37_01420 [Nanoarchaeota archaeon]|nr:hypothetical protein [Nanoarchaeota archaeon]
MKLSQEKKDKITEQILSFLFHIYPKSKFTSEIAREIARDEEFVKAIMLGLKEKTLVTNIRKNPQGVFYSRRIRWRISNNAYDSYNQ